jgi:hypothetical protein
VTALMTLALNWARRRGPREPAPRHRKKPFRHY